MADPIEEWRDVPGFESRYQVSDLGRVRSLRPTVRVMPPTMSNGRRRVGLWDGERQVFFYVSRLVLLAFRGPCPPGMEGCHEDDDKTNNVLSNLRWDTRPANRVDACRNGKTPAREKHWAAKLTEAAVAEIRRLRGPGVSQQAKRRRGSRLVDLAKRFGVSTVAVSAAARGETWV